MPLKFRAGKVENIFPRKRFSIGSPLLEPHPENRNKPQKVTIVADGEKIIASLLTQGTTILYMRSEMSPAFVKKYHFTPMEELLRHFVRGIDSETFTTTGTTAAGHNFLKGFLERNNAGVISDDIESFKRVSLRPESKIKLKPALQLE